VEWTRVLTQTGAPQSHLSSPLSFNSSFLIETSIMAKKGSKFTITSVLWVPRGAAKSIAARWEPTDEEEKEEEKQQIEQQSEPNETLKANSKKQSKKYMKKNKG
jgi:hypothetical protein